MSNLFQESTDPCYSSYEMEVGSLVGSKSALLANLSRRFPGHGDKAKLAREIGVSPSTVTRWFKGERPISLDDLDKIAEKLGVPPKSLIVDYADKNSTGVTVQEALDIIAANLPKDA